MISLVRTLMAANKKAFPVISDPFDDRVIFVSLFNCAGFSRGFSEVAQTLDAISGNQFLVDGSGFGEVWLLSTV
jgi:hypothetical protein